MGFNTAVIILNDHLGYIEDDKDFGKKLHDACLSTWTHEATYTNEFKVITSSHADHETVIVMHGNTGKVLSPYAHESKRIKEEDAMRILGNLAEMYGYRLVKKGARKWHPKN